jgi:hypothetical protein
VEQNFAPEIEDILQSTGRNRETYLEESAPVLKKTLTVYNPFGLLNHFNKMGEFLPYWYETGTPTFLLKLIEHQNINILDLNNLRVSYDDFRKFDVENMKAVPSEITTRIEYYYETAVHLIFTMIGTHCHSEVRISSGRIDTLVETKGFVYCFEFKLNGTVKEALEQIDSKEYLLSWKGSGKTLFKIGVEFDHEHHNIGAWEMVKIGDWNYTNI